MATVWIVPAGTDSADGAAPGDYLLRPDGDTYEVGRQDAACTWFGSIGTELLPDLPQVDSPQQAPEQDKALAAVQAVETAEHLRGG